MTTINKLFRQTAIGKYFSICLLLSVCLLTKAQDGSLTVIGNLKGVPSEMKMAELKSVFKAERQRWSDGTKVTIAMIKSTTPLGKIISQRIYAMSGDEVRGFWAGISFAGKFESPVTFNTVSELENFVAQNPGTIAIMDKVPESAEVKTVMIDGKKIFDNRATGISFLHWTFPGAIHMPC